MSMSPGVLRLPQVSDYTGLSKASVYRQVKEGTFPRPIRLGSRAVGWLTTEVTEWIAARPRVDTWDRQRRDVSGG